MCKDSKYTYSVLGLPFVRSFLYKGGPITGSKHNLTPKRGQKTMKQSAFQNILRTEKRECLPSKKNIQISKPIFAHPIE